MAIDRRKALQGLASKLPTQNQQSLQNLQAAQRVQTRQQLAAAPASLSVRQAQPLAAQSTAQQGQAEIGAAQTGLQQQNALGQAALANQAQLNQEDLFGREQRLKAAANANANKLAQIDERAKNEILDSRLKFKAAEANRQFLNTRQLLDWKALNAESEQDFMDTVQQMEQTATRNMQIQETAYKKLKQALSQDYQYGSQNLDQKTRAKIQEMITEFEKETASKERKAARKGAIGAGIGTIAGAVMGGGGGAVAGGSIGGSLGSQM